MLQVVTGGRGGIKKVLILRYVIFEQPLGVFFHEIECNGMTSFMEFMMGELRGEGSVCLADMHSDLRGFD